MAGSKVQPTWCNRTVRGAIDFRISLVAEDGRWPALLSSKLFGENWYHVASSVKYTCAFLIHGIEGNR
jgi:hypothetical protein